MDKKFLFLGLLILMLAGSTSYFFTQNRQLKEEIKVEKKKEPEQEIVRVPEKVEKTDVSKVEVVSEDKEENSVEKTSESNVQSDISSNVVNQSLLESKQEVLAFMDSFVQNYFVVDDVKTHNEYLQAHVGKELFDTLVVPDDYLLTVTQETIIEDQTFYVDFVDDMNVRIAGIVDLRIGNVPQSMFGSFELVKKGSDWIVETCTFESITSSTEAN